MILRDTVTAISRTSGDEIATMRGQVAYRTVTLDQQAGGGPSFQITQQLTALTDPWEWSMSAHRLRFRGEDFDITGLLHRRRNGRDHHVTLQLERVTG